MPALNFQARFADAVERGEKRQTVRRVRKRPIVVWDRLHLFTGQRTTGCRRLGTETCLYVNPITIDVGKRAIHVVCNKFSGGTVLKRCDNDAFATRDGFASSEEMFDWFKKRYGCLFEGVLIQW